MACHFIRDDNGQLIAIACTTPWGIGTVIYHFEEGDEIIYGFPHSNCDPHDFFPDIECCSPEEIAAWEECKSKCQCGRE